MKILLDTHTFIWWATDPQQLSSRALTLCHDPKNQLALSVVSIWEMVIKTQIGKLQFAKPLAEMVADQWQRDARACRPRRIVTGTENLHRQLPAFP